MIMDLMTEEKINTDEWKGVRITRMETNNF